MLDMDIIQKAHDQRVQKIHEEINQLHYKKGWWMGFTSGFAIGVVIYGLIRG